MDFADGDLAPASPKPPLRRPDQPSPTRRTRRSGRLAPVVAFVHVVPRGALVAGAAIDSPAVNRLATARSHR